jgi:hypothetical protein
MRLGVHSRCFWCAAGICSTIAEYPARPAARCSPPLTDARRGARMDAWGEPGDGPRSCGNATGRSWHEGGQDPGAR